MENLLENEEVYWRQRARSDWLKGGDRNSKFFHARASSRKCKNGIKEVTDMNGVNCASNKDIAAAFTDFYNKLFMTSLPSDRVISEAITPISNKLTTHQISSLSSNFTPDEVRQAIFSMGPSKAPGEDGFQLIFYQKFWHVVGKDITDTCLKILNQGYSVMDHNHTLITLIPKIPNPTTVSDY